jgi:hypothetical protein
MVQAPIIPYFLGIVVMAAAFIGAGVIAWRWLRGRKHRITEPECGKCGYCVRGVAELTCPECGSDLREVGILAPGDQRPRSRAKKLLIWTLIAPLPGLVLGGMVASVAAPYYLRLTEHRVIELPGKVITVDRHGRVLDFGRSLHAAAVPMQVTILTLNMSVPASMTVLEQPRTFSYTPAAGGIVRGSFDVAAIERWLASQGVIDPRLPGWARQVAVAIDQMDTSAAYQSYTLPPLPSADGGVTGTVSAMTITPASQPTVITAATPVLVAAAVWLAGLPFVLRAGERRRADVVSRSLSPAVAA